MAELKDTHEAPRVTVSVGYTRNMGNFESLRIDIGVEDSARNGEKVGDTFDRVYAFVEKKLIEKVNEVEKGLSGD